VPKIFVNGQLYFNLSLKTWSHVFFGTQCIFKFLYGPPRFFLRGKFIPKIAIFGDFGGRKDTFLKKVAVTVGTWETLPRAKFCKNCLRGYTHLGKYIPKITNVGDFGGSKPTFLKPQRKNLARGCKFGRHSPHQIW